MKKVVIFIFCLFVQYFSTAQMVVNCKIQNTEGKSLPYAIAFCINNNSGIAADDNGELSIKVNNTTDSIRFSMMGYCTMTKLVENIIKNNIVTLEPQIYNLNEVVITNKQSQFVSLLDGKSASIVLNGRPGSILLVKIDNDEKAGEIISKITAQVKQIPKLKDANIFKLRVRVYSVSKDDFPEYDLLTETVEVQISKDQKLIVADISNYNISLPVSGAFVGFEWLPKEQVEIDYTRKITGPNITTTTITNKELTVFGSIGGDWEYFSMEDAPFFVSKKTKNAKIGVEFK
jgi:hypothetical protein